MPIFAAPSIGKIYKMLSSTIGGWFLSMELDFVERDVDFRKGWCHIRTCSQIVYFGIK